MSVQAKTVLIVTLLLGIFLVPAASALTSTIYYPTPADLNDLDHNRYYSWGINYNSDAPIVEAVLRINNVYDWIHEPGDSLYMHLLNYAPLGVHSGYDNEGGGDHFAGNPWIATWSDPNGDFQHRQNLSYSFSSLGLLDELNSFAANDGRFGLGFDADCHYYNSGVELEITTGVTPEPATMLLLGLGLLGTAAFRRIRG